MIEKPFLKYDMKISRERLIDELAHYMTEVSELRSIRNRLEIELSKAKDEIEKLERELETA